MPRAAKKSPLEFPQSADTWYFASRRLRAWIVAEDDEPVRPYLLIVVNLGPGTIQYLTVGSKPVSKEVQKALFTAMSRPPRELKTEPQRPARIFFEDRQLQQSLAPALQEIGVQAMYRPRLEELDELVEELEARLSGDHPEIPGLLSGAKVTAKLVGALFATAADFYRAAPWVQLANEDVLAIRVPPQKEPYFVSVMGQGGVEYGLALYKNWEDVQRMYLPHDDPLEVIPPGGSHSLLFSEITDVPFDDLDAIEKYGWAVADPGAYPVPSVFLPPDQVRRPDRDEIVWYEAALRTIPEFVRQHWSVSPQGEAQPAEARIPVATAAGEVTVEVKYPAGELPLAHRAAVDFEALEEEGPPGPPFDRRAMEGDMARMFGRFADQEADPELEKAQELMCQAWGERNPARRIALARRALRTSPDCADAYVLLAEEEAGTVQQALAYYREGVAAGERALGQDYFKENAGHFWGLLKTRPYMRALEGVASCLWQLGRKEEALNHYNQLLHLNPNDNQGIRYVLADLLLSLNRDAELAKLLRQYREEWSAVWLYTQALLAFRKSGSSPKADRTLQTALEENRHVPAYLTGKKRIPNRLPDYVGIGDDAEAVVYAAHHLNYWRRTPGAIQWLKRHTPPTPPPKARR